eukprot:379614_1
MPTPNTHSPNADKYYVLACKHTVRKRLPAHKVITKERHYRHYLKYLKRNTKDQAKQTLLRKVFKRSNKWVKKRKKFKRSITKRAQKKCHKALFQQNLFILAFQIRSKLKLASFGKEHKAKRRICTNVMSEYGIKILSKPNVKLDELLGGTKDLQMADKYG